MCGGGLHRPAGWQSGARCSFQTFTVWYPWYVTSHTYQVTRVWCATSLVTHVSGIPGVWPPIHTRWHMYSALHPWLHTCLVSLPPPIHTRWHVHSVLHPWLHTCLVSQVCDLPYIPGDTCPQVTHVSGIPGMCLVCYIPDLHVSGIWGMGFKVTVTERYYIAGSKILRT